MSQVIVVSRPWPLRAAGAVTDLLQSVKGAWLRWRERALEREAMRALSQLDERTLRDLGWPHVARHAGGAFGPCGVCGRL